MIYTSVQRSPPPIQQRTGGSAYGRGSNTRHFVAATGVACRRPFAIDISIPEVRVNIRIGGYYYRG
jgi:hypothetical protein